MHGTWATSEVSEYNLTSNVKLVDFPGAGTPRIQNGLKGIDCTQFRFYFSYSVSDCRNLNSNFLLQLKSGSTFSFWNAWDIRNFYILYYSVIIIATCGRFNELDLELANICHRNRVKFIFVRTKFDRDVREAYRNTEEEIDDFSIFIRQIQRRLRSELYELLEEFKTPLYFINGLRLKDYSFPQLLKSINKIVNSSDELRAFQLPHLENCNVTCF